MRVAVGAVLVGLMQLLDSGSAIAGATIIVDPLTGRPMALIDQEGNASDTNGLGHVADPYLIALHEVTNTQYVELLNAVAATDPNGLYDEIMTDSDRGGILRSGSPGSYSYSVKPNFENKPANGFSWYDAARFCNWLHNGKPSGAQGPATTEDGAYDLSLPGSAIVRKPGADYFIPTHDEWYKAAYYDTDDPGADASGTPNYWRYPNATDLAPTLATATAAGDVANPGPNVANMDQGADWNGENGNVTTVSGTTSVGPWGLFDMAGNINEQTETLGTPIPDDPPLPTRKIRGGDFSNPTILASSPAGFSPSLNMLAEGANIGFRVAAPFCPLPIDPEALTVARDGGDVVLSWDDSPTAIRWNVYRDPSPDPAGWGPPHAPLVSDGDPPTPGIQFRDVGAIAEGSLFYLVTGINGCGESAIN